MSSVRIENHEVMIASGDLFLKDQQNDDALKCYLKALQISDRKGWKNETLVRFYNNLAIVYKRQGDFVRAENILRLGISFAPQHTIYYSNLFSIYKTQNRLEDAERLLLRALALPQKDAHHFIALIELYKQRKELKKELETSVLFVKTFPENYEAHLTLGNVFTGVKAYAQALEPYLAAIRLNPKDTRAYNNIGIVYKELGDYAKGEVAYKNALALSPNDSAAHNNYGNLLRQMDQYQEAISHLKLSIKQNPKFADAYSNIGAVYKELKSYDQAEPYYLQALSLNPHHTNANFDLALIELVRGNYSVGWKRYEYRLQMGELISKLYKYKTPIWRGESLKDKRLILQNEQGYGDNIMFIRYVPMFIALGATVIIRTRPQLVMLFETIEGVSAVVSEEDAIPEHDYYLPLLSSALRFGTTLQTIPSKFPYLSAPRSDKKMAQLEAKGFKIGIVWSSSKTNKDFKNKYLGLKNFKNLLKIKKAKWYSLQVGDDVEEIRDLGLSHELIDLSESLVDFATTASVIEKLDLVITTDTSVAHLCGAMDKEAWVIVPKPADWRWAQEGTQSPWYKSLLLFRQNRSGEWDDVMKEIEKRILKKLH